MKQRILIASALILGVLLVWLAFFWQPPATDTANRASNDTPGSHAPSLPPGGDFSLQGPQGPLSLADYRGRIVLVYFGYTFCPDVCPTALSAMGQAFSMLTPEEQAGVAGVFVSVDPERDTTDVLKAYAPFFHPQIVGVTGSVDDIARVARQYGVRYMKQKADDGKPYSVDHTSFTYVIDASGKLIAQLPHGSPPQAIIDMIRTLRK
ncbi:SCO family protein [Propionivibrio soli]|uniref:SCO family protein n=1 Tax=Propionivibrio soli TaxID=2976531 RepID=UPI0021E7E739|nr:SCO family protein [Propionivibrio soli]